MKEAFTFNQVNDQEISAYKNGSADKPTVLVKRSDGRITVGKLDKETREVSFTEDGQDKYKTASMLALSDQVQGELAQELAGSSLLDQDSAGMSPEVLRGEEKSKVIGNAVLDASGVENPSKPDDGLGPRERIVLNMYDDAMAEKRRAQQEGRGEDSIYWGQVAGQYSKELSEIRGK